MLQHVNNSAISFNAAIVSVVRQKQTNDGLWAVLKVTCSDMLPLGLAAAGITSQIFEVTGLVPGGLLARDNIMCTGSVIIDGRYGNKFRASDIQLIKPKTSDEVRDHLACITGVGRVNADKVARMLENEPDPIAAILRNPMCLLTVIDQVVADLIERQLRMRWSLWDAEVFLFALGLRRADIRRVCDALFGRDIKAVMSADPFAAVDAIGFPKCDMLSEELKMARDAPERVDAGVVWVAESECKQRGHCAILSHWLGMDAQDKLGVTGECVQNAMARLIERQSIIISDQLGEILAYPKRYWHAEENSVCAMTKILLKSRTPIPTAADPRFTPSPDQLAAINIILQSRISILTGMPGAGKTTVVKQILNAVYDVDQRAILCAPTGMAARRMKQCCSHDATTIHRALGKSDGVTLGNADVVIVDELSMISIELFRDLITAIRPGAMVLFVGDPDQLSSIDPGKVLQDLIDSGEIPICRLTNNHRQANGSLLSQNIARVNRGEMPILTPGNVEFRTLFYSDPVECVRATVLAVKYLMGIAENKKFDIQVITPMNKGSSGADGLNRELRDVMRLCDVIPDGPSGALSNDQKIHYGASTNGFSAGDKVIQCENDYDRGVINGEIGIVESVINNALVVKFDDHSVLYSLTEQDQLKHAYAITVHKSQGSEFKYVILVVTNSAGPMLNRRLIYTGMSRGRERVVIVGQENALKRAIENVKCDERNTGLAAKLSASMRNIRDAPAPESQQSCNAIEDVQMAIAEVNEVD